MSDYDHRPEHDWPTTEPVQRRLDEAKDQMPASDYRAALEAASKSL